MGNFTPRSRLSSRRCGRWRRRSRTLTAFAAIVNDVMTNNPFGCTAYQSGGVAHAGRREDARGLHGPDHLRGQRGRDGRHGLGQVPDGRGLHRVVTTVPAATAITTAIGETGAHATDDDSFSATLKCHDANGELYNVSFSRTAVTVSGYTADAILTAVETWADTVPALA